MDIILLLIAVTAFALFVPEIRRELAHMRDNLFVPIFCAVGSALRTRFGILQLFIAMFVVGLIATVTHYLGAVAGVLLSPACIVLGVIVDRYWRGDPKRHGVTFTAVALLTLGLLGCLIWIGIQPY